ncbi:hypothetical protein ACO2Q3_11855 [Caulobacter sp. KR2-114]|uniref:hypothetical protein n=1 Tax=Caulobacter sp. KR2-114 TaxID=3400912 RepID=UPI003C105FB1
MSDALWTSDFRFAGRRVTVKKTGAEVAIDRETLKGLGRWLAWYLPVRLKGAIGALDPAAPRVWFAPDRPRPWYLVWAAAAWSGVAIARSPAEADAAFYFDDVTLGRPPTLRAVRCLNFDCVDVSKSHVAKVFEAVFGYPLAVDPRAETGLVVEKSEANGVHDGRVVCCPRAATPARVYQRLVDNVEDGHAVDLRTPFVGGRPVLTFIKRRPVARRFDNWNASVTLALPEDVFSREEIERLSAFARAMKLDWGGLDILRDARDGRLYVVDVNKTDMPPLALPWIDKLRATARLGAAFRTLVTAPEVRS